MNTLSLLRRRRYDDYFDDLNAKVASLMIVAAEYQRDAKPDDALRCLQGAAGGDNFCLRLAIGLDKYALGNTTRPCESRLRF